MNSNRAYFKKRLEENTEELNLALLKLRHGTINSTDVYEILNRRAIIKDHYIEELEAILAMLEEAQTFNKAS